MRSIGALIVRLTVGGLLAGHGAQKLFGSFGGAGLEGTADWLEAQRLRPGNVWAPVAGTAELSAGVLTGLGFLNPLGPIAGIAAMTMAWAKVHLDRPVWVTSGGAELPLTNAAVLAGVAIAGPGAISLDGLLGVRVPRRVTALAVIATAAAVWAGARPELEHVAEEVTAGGLRVSRGTDADDDEAVDGADSDAGPESSRGASGSRKRGSAHRHAAHAGARETAASAH